MLAAAGDLRPGPAYVWGRLGTRAEYVKIMIDSGNTVGDLVSEEFAQRLGLEGDDIQDHIAVPTATAKAQLDEEDWEWLTALGVAMALPQPRPAGTGGQPLGRQEAPRSTQGPRSTGRGW